HGPSAWDPRSAYTLVLSASGSSVDSIDHWTIAWGDGSVETLPGNPTTVSHSYPLFCRAYTISATADISGAAFAASNTASVRIELPNENMCFVARVYNDLFGRFVDPSGLNFWSQFLDSGPSHAALTLGLENTDEYRTIE